MKHAIRHHIYIPGQSDRAALKPQTRCADCGLPKTNQRHQLPALSEDQKAAEAARLGDRGD